VEGALASLTFNPEIIIVFLIETQLLFPFDIDLFHFGLAVVTNDIVLIAKYVLATETLFLDNGKFA
jgi:hypothetical protein